MTTAPTSHRGLLVQRGSAVGDGLGFQRYQPREPGGAGTLNYGDDTASEVSAVHWLRERHICSLGVPLSAGLFHMEVSEFDFTFVAEETMVLLRGAVEVTIDDEAVSLQAGDMAFFPAGLVTRWVVVKPTTVFFTLLD